MFCVCSGADGEIELGGVWQYRQVGDDISLNGEDEEEDNKDFFDEEALSTPLPADTGIGFFDPLNQPDSIIDDSTTTNAWLLSSLDDKNSDTPHETEVLEVTIESGFHNVKFDIAQSNSPVSEESVASTSGERQSGVQSGKGDLVSSPISRPSSKDILKPHTLECTGLPQNDSPRSIHKNSSLLNLDLQDKGDYIVQAAKQISLAQHCEAGANFNLAFNYYKNGVGILLTGVQCKW